MGGRMGLNFQPRNIGGVPGSGVPTDDPQYPSHTNVRDTWAFSLLACQAGGSTIWSSTPLTIDMYLDGVLVIGEFEPDSMFNLVDYVL